MKHFFVAFLLLPVLSWSQYVLQTSKTPMLAYNRFDNSYLVLDDSSQWREFSLKDMSWHSHPLNCQLELPFAQFKERFFPIAVGHGRYYFGVNGCGWVYELKHNTLKRIDCSFDQKNQFGAAVYEYKSRLYYFGGYGLFEVKNTHTRFLTDAKEWFQVIRHTNSCPSPRVNPLFIRLGERLFLFGGVFKERMSEEALKDAWVYNCATKCWRLLGELNPELLKIMRTLSYPMGRDFRIFIHANKLVFVDPLKNKYTSYESPLYLSFHAFLPSADHRFALVMQHNSNDTQTAKLSIRNTKRILEGNPREHFLFKKTSFFKKVSTETYLWWSIIINLGLFFLVFYIRRLPKTNWYKPRNPKIKRADFTELEWEIMLKICATQELELSALNDYFDEDGLSYETLKKRRESFIKALRIKMALVTRRDVEQMLVETKHPLDKRMKIIQWNKELEISE